VVGRGDGRGQGGIGVFFQVKKRKAVWLDTALV